jgi:hypothetical protein
MYLDNLWGDCKDNPSDRVCLVQRYLDPVINGEFFLLTKSKSDIVPIIRSTDYLQRSMEETEKNSHELGADNKSTKAKLVSMRSEHRDSN